MASVGGTRRKLAQQSYEAGGAGEIAVLQLVELKFDHTYQRDVIADVIERISQNYDIVTAGTIVVSRRENGDLYVVDGQHRVAAAMLAGETEILAQVIEGLSPQEEAHLRIIGNYSRKDTVYETFRARVFAGDEDAIALKAEVEAYGTRINYIPDTSHGISAIRALERIYALDKGQTLRRTLTTIETGFGAPPEGPKTSANMLKAVAWFLSRHSNEHDRQRLWEKMRELGPAALGRNARNYRASLGGALWVNTYRALVDAYNQGLRSESNMLEWRTTRSSVSLGGTRSDDAGDGGRGDFSPLSLGE